MKLQIFSIYDSATEAFINPFFSPTVASGIRAFSTVCADENHDFHKNAGDYTLFHLGEFDPTNGLITLLESHCNLGLALNYKSTGEKS